ncbi:MAG: hydantoinase/oxoprolinase family protein [Gaiellales bacterium]
MTSYRIGIDVGGTFTDFFLRDSEGGVETFKVLSTPEDPSVGVLQGLAGIADGKGLGLEGFTSRIRTIVHGTTVTTNAVLTRGGARTALLTTEGVRDALEMRRGIREEQYDNHCLNVRPLVPRRHRLPVPGRMDYRGEELRPLDLERVRGAVAELKAAGTEAVAICFMNAFANPAHERAAAELLRAELPGAYLCASTDVLPSIRFYNRVSTAVLNAYVGPVLTGYLSRLTERLRDVGFEGILLIMQSSGGVASPELTARQAASTLLSGPAAGPRAALGYTENGNDCIVVDMGGTSFDASLVQDGSVALSTESEIDRLRIALPMLQITTIGAGGGSIGWIDQGGLLRMGPRSAGALPGPACYGRGGEEPTCTDADLILGYLDPDWFAGGKLRLDTEAARAAVRSRIAEPLGMDIEEAAAGMYRMINANMAHGVRQITVERGLDPREFPMLVAGGAGALHAAMIANELDIGTLLVPPTASILCATGMLSSDLQHDFVASYVTPLSRIEPSCLVDVVDGLRNRGEELLEHEGIPAGDRRHQVSLDLRYLDQYHEVTVPVSLEAVRAGRFDEIAEAFHVRHDRLYGYELRAEGTDLELINARVRSVGLVEKPELPRLEEGGEDPRAALKESRRAYVPEQAGFDEIEVYDGHALEAGYVIEGPALIERIDTTIFVSASFVARVDRHGTCVLRRRT